MICMIKYKIEANSIWELGMNIEEGYNEWKREKDCQSGNVNS